MWSYLVPRRLIMWWKPVSCSSYFLHRARYLRRKSRDRYSGRRLDGSDNWRQPNGTVRAHHPDYERWRWNFDTVAFSCSCPRSCFLKWNSFYTFRDLLSHQAINKTWLCFYIIYITLYQHLKNGFYWNSYDIVVLLVKAFRPILSHRTIEHNSKNSVRYKMVESHLGFVCFRGSWICRRVVIRSCYGSGAGVVNGDAVVMANANWRIGISGVLCRWIFCGQVSLLWLQSKSLLNALLPCVPNAYGHIPRRWNILRNNGKIWSETNKTD